MFRITIRELMAFVLAAAMGIAWLVEHRQLQAAVARETATRAQSDSWEGQSKSLEKQIDQIKKQLPDHGLEIKYTCGFIGSFPLVCETSADQPASNRIEN